MLNELTESEVRSAIRSMWLQRIAWFAASVVIMAGCFEIAGQSTGPSADIVLGIGSIFGLPVIVSGIFLAAFFSESRQAIRDVAHYKNDPAAFRKIHSGIFRIAWK